MRPAAPCAVTCLALTLFLGTNYLTSRAEAQQQARAVPMRWCGVEGSPILQNPANVNEASVADALWRRHERTTDGTFTPDANVTLRSSVIAGIRDNTGFPPIPDPDTTSGSPGDIQVPSGSDVATSDEFNKAYNTCVGLWVNTLCPPARAACGGTDLGIVAINARKIVGSTATIKGAAVTGARKLVVEDPSFRLDPARVGETTLPLTELGSVLDDNETVFGHEVGHALPARTCIRGSNAGLPCDAEDDCPGGGVCRADLVCKGGNDDGKLCCKAAEAPCPSGLTTCPSGTCTDRRCQGGPEDRQPCLADADCALSGVDCSSPTASIADCGKCVTGQFCQCSDGGDTCALKGRLCATNLQCNTGPGDFSAFCPQRGLRHLCDARDDGGTLVPSSNDLMNRDPYVDANGDGIADSFRLYHSAREEKQSASIACNDAVAVPVDQPAVVYDAAARVPGCKRDNCIPTPGDNCDCTAFSDVRTDTVEETANRFLDLSMLFATEPETSAPRLEFAHELFGIFDDGASQFTRLLYFVLADMDANPNTGAPPSAVTDLIGLNGVTFAFRGAEMVTRVEVFPIFAGGGEFETLDRVVPVATAWRFVNGAFEQIDDPGIRARIDASVAITEAEVAPLFTGGDVFGPSRGAFPRGTVDCGSSDFPVCAGTCPPDLVCRPAADGDSCACTSPSEEVHTSDAVTIELPNAVVGDLHLPIRLKPIVVGVPEDGPPVLDSFGDPTGDEGKDFWVAPPTFPACQLAPDPVGVGGETLVHAVGLLPETMVKVFFGDTMVGSGLADDKGGVAVPFRIPDGVVDERHLVTVGSVATAVEAGCVVGVAAAPSAEICANCLDDDGNRLIDCEDTTACACLPIGNNPGRGRIRVGVGKFGTGGRDQLKVHVTIKPGTPIDPSTETVGVVLTNGDGLMFRQMLTPGAMKQKGELRFDFRNRTALRARNGIARLTLQNRPTRGYYRVTLELYGDLSQATRPDMKLQIKVGDDAFINATPWVQTRTGWKLTIPDP
jgi:hypothetical protein